jgi:hypothetical protein
MLKLKYFLSTVALVCALILTSCEGDPPLPAIDASFDADALGFEGTEATFKVILSRETAEDLPLDITLTTTNLVYGTQFTTEPAATDGKIVLTIPAGTKEGTIKVIKPANVTLNGDERIAFTLTPVEPIVPGEKLSLDLSFTAITSEGSTITLAGKAATPSVPPVSADNYVNAVYADLSANSQTAVSRKSWNLGFLSGSDFKVILNPGYQTTAAPLTKTDINTVTLADAETVTNLAHDALITDPITIPLADAWTGDLTKTTFATVSATDSENKVYLVSFEGSKTPKEKWFKVKVSRNGSGYRVLFARIGETTIQTLDVPKNDAFNMTFVSLENNAIVSVEPPKRNWDIEWGYSTNDSGLGTPYWTQDFILLNYIGGAEASEQVSTGGVDAAANIAAATDAYNNYNEAKVSTTTFVKTRDAIGAKWRTVAAPGAINPGVNRDRFYVVKDPSGNVYKLKFVSYGVPTGNGERGRPVIEYKLVKKAG